MRELTPHAQHVLTHLQNEGVPPGYLSIRMLARYSGLSVRTLRKHLGDPVHPLPHYRVGGRILVSRTEFDRWLIAFRESDPPSVDAIVADVLKGL